MGPGTLEVPLAMFAENRRRLASQLPSDTIVVMQGGDDIPFYETDTQYLFRQVRLFFIKTFRYCI